MRDAQRVASFEKFERSFAVDAEDGVLNMSVGGGVCAAAYQIEFGFDVFGSGAESRSAFHDDHVAGSCHGEVRVGGDDQAESLQVGVRLEVRVAVLKGDFSEIYR